MDFDFDTDVCVCFHVSVRKLWHYTRREQLQHYTQLTECLGAGTGCQSCVPLLRKIAELAPAGDREALLSELKRLATKRDERRRQRLNRPND